MYGVFCIVYCIFFALCPLPSIRSTLSLRLTYKQQEHSPHHPISPIPGCTAPLQLVQLTPGSTRIWWNCFRCHCNPSIYSHLICFPRTIHSKYVCVCVCVLRAICVDAKLYIEVNWNKTQDCHMKPVVDIHCNSSFVRLRLQATFYFKTDTDRRHIEPVSVGSITTPRRNKLWMRINRKRIGKKNSNSIHERFRICEIQTFYCRSPFDGNDEVTLFVDVILELQINVWFVGSILHFNAHEDA